MILADTNILSTFAKINGLDLLMQLFQDDIAVVPSVYKELRDGVDKGYHSLSRILELIDERNIKILPLTENEIIGKAKLPASFDEGELETIIVAINRHLLILTNEKRVGNYCKNKGIQYLSLPDLFRAMWCNGVLSKSDVRDLVNKIEEKDNIKFKSIENIFINEKI